MKRLLLFWLVFMVFLTGCIDIRSRILVFRGESNDWKAEYVVDSTEEFTKGFSGKLHYQDYSTKRLKLKYKGPDASSLGSIKYSYDAGLYGGSGDAAVDKYGNALTGYSSGGNLLRKDEIIVVTIAWKGQKETIKLTSEGD